MTLDNETKQQLRALFDQALNEKVATMKTEILNEILGKVESKMHTITAVSESFNKLGQHAAACKPNEVKNEISSLKADVLELHKNISTIKDALATGRGTMAMSARLTNEDYKRLADARLQAAKLSEVVEFVEGSEGQYRG